MFYHGDAGHDAASLSPRVRRASRLGTVFGQDHLHDRGEYFPGGLPSVGLWSNEVHLRSSTPLR